MTLPGGSPDALHTVTHSCCRSGATLLLDDDFWPQGSWAWRLFRVNRSTAAQEPRLLSLKKVGFPPSSAPRLTVDTWDRMWASMNERQMLQLGHGVSYSKFVKRWECNTWTHVHTGERTSCSATSSWFCHGSLPGVWDRVIGSEFFSSLLVTPLSDVSKGAPLSSAPSSSSSDGNPSPSSGDDNAAFIRVVWHLRTGDVRSQITDQLIHRLNSTLLTPNLTRRPVRHYVLADPDFVEQLRESWPSVEQLVLSGTDLDHVQTMAAAHVLVSTGSSFAIAAAALAPLGQLHIFFPPKECYPRSGKDAPPRAGGDGPSAAPSPPTGASFCRRCSYWRTYFMRRNTVPVDTAGAPFPEYTTKLRRMLHAFECPLHTVTYRHMPLRTVLNARYAACIRRGGQTWRLAGVASVGTLAIRRAPGAICTAGRTVTRWLHHGNTRLHECYIIVTPGAIRG